MVLEHILPNADALLECKMTGAYVAMIDADDLHFAVLAVTDGALQSQWYWSTFCRMRTRCWSAK